MRENHTDAKESLRRQMIAMRREVPLQTRQDWSRSICRRVCESDTFARATHVVAYAPLGAEVDPGDAAVAVLATGRALYYPTPDGEPTLRRARGVSGTTVALSEDGEDSLAEGVPGVLFLVPGIAFDETGGRLGRGRGWYDRLLCRYPQAWRWGLAFALQVIPRLPVDPWDVPMNAVVTERDRIDAGRSLALPEGMT